jgi:hypothetical protein
MNARLRTSEPVPLKEAQNLVLGVGPAQWVRKLGVLNKVLLDSNFQLVRIACRAERADNVGYFFLGVLHVSESEGRAGADTV